MRWLLPWAVCLGLLGCDDGAKAGDVDAASMADALVDMGARDAVVLDAHAPRDMSLDAAVDGVDAQVDAAVDLGVDATVECVGVQLPAYPDSPDGREVCNHRDDDGDGLVDEGFEYDFVGGRVSILPEPLEYGDEFQMIATDRGFAVAWEAGFGLRFVTLDARGCRTSEVAIVDQNPEPGAVHAPNSLAIAASADRHAAVFTEERLPALGRRRSYGTFVQLFDADGVPLGVPIDIDPDQAFFGANAIVGLDDGRFAVFGGAFHPRTGGQVYSAFVILDRDGNIVQGPSHPYEVGGGMNQALIFMIGMAWDGEGFGMAWESVGNWFMRWSAEGEVLVPPTRSGVTSRRSGIIWTGEHYVVPSRGDHSWLFFFERDGTRADWSPLTLGSPGHTRRIQAVDGGFVQYGSTPRVTVGRYDARGRLGAVTRRLSGREDEPLDVAAGMTDPIGALMGHLARDEEQERWTLGLRFTVLGCPEGGD